jgi:hypothetical protein
MPVATFDEIFSSGSRSFAIWTAGGELKFDKGDDLQMATSAGTALIARSSRKVKLSAHSAEAIINYRAIQP